MKMYREWFFLFLFSICFIGLPAPMFAQSADDILQQHVPETDTKAATTDPVATSGNAPKTEASSSEDERFNNLFDSIFERLLKIFERLTGIVDTLSKNLKKSTTTASKPATKPAAKPAAKPADKPSSNADSVSQKINDIALTFPKIYNGYKKFPYAAGTEGGNLGCANVVSAVLKKAGVPVWSLSVSGVKSQLLALKAPNNWKLVSPPPYQPGYVVCWSAPSGSIHGHIGVVVKNGNTYSAMNNSSGSRKPILSTPVNHRKIACVLRRA